MKKLLILVILLFGCTNSNNREKALYYNNLAINLMMKDNSYNSALKAIQYLDSAIALDPSFLTAYSNKVNYLFYLKKFEEAIDVLNLAENINPVLSEIYLNKGLAYNALGKTDESKSNLLYCMKLSSSFLTYNEKINYFSAYTILYGKESALKKLEKSVEEKKINEKDLKEIKNFINDFNIWEFEHNISN